MRNALAGDPLDFVAMRVMGLLWRRYGGVMVALWGCLWVALWGCYGAVMVALWWRYGAVMVALWWRYALPTQTGCGLHLVTLADVQAWIRIERRTGPKTA